MIQFFLEIFLPIGLYLAGFTIMIFVIIDVIKKLLRKKGE